MLYVCSLEALHPLLHFYSILKDGNITLGGHAKLRLSFIYLLSILNDNTHTTSKPHPHHPLPHKHYRHHYRLSLRL